MADDTSVMSVFRLLKATFSYGYLDRTATDLGSGLAGYLFQWIEVGPPSLSDLIGELELVRVNCGGVE